MLKVPIWKILIETMHKNEQRMLNKLTNLVFNACYIHYGLKKRRKVYLRGRMGGLQGHGGHTGGQWGYGEPYGST